MGTQKRIILITFIPILFMGILVIYGWQTLSHISTEVDQLFNENLIPIIDTEIEELIGLRNSIQCILKGEKFVLQASLEEQLPPSETSQAAHQSTIKKALEFFNRSRSSLRNESSLELYNQFYRQFLKWEAASSQILTSKMDTPLAFFPNSMDNRAQMFKKILEIKNYLIQKEDIIIDSIQERKLVAAQLSNCLFSNVDFSIIIFLLLGTSGTILGLIMAIQTARKFNKQNQQLKQYSENLESIVEERTAALTEAKQYVDNIIYSMTDTLIVINSDTEIQTVNQKTLDLLGYEKQELIGESIRTVLEEEQGLFIGTGLTELIKKSFVKGIELNYVTKSGEKILMQFSGLVMRSGDGSVQGIVCISQDITERKQAELALEKQRKWLETTLSSIGDAIIATDMNACVVFMNSVAEDLTGWISQNAQGHAIEEIFNIVNEETRNPVTNPVHRAIEKGTIVGLANHTILISKDGQEIPIDDSAAPIRRGDELLGVILVFRDISKRKQAEEQLKISKKQAEKANQAKTQFLANMSHEIRTPLNSIVGFSQILMNQAKEYNFPREVLRYLDNIQISGQNLSELINNILDLSKIEAGKMDVSIEPLNFKLLVQEIFHINKVQALQKELDYTYDFDPKIPEIIESDRTRLNQILMNLIGNALKFTPEGKRVHLRAKKQEDFILIQVSDEGIGISKDKQIHIFESFEQVDETITRQFGGTGLGLAITKKMVELLNGEIGVESELGKGSTFFVKIPLIESFALLPEQRKVLPEDLYFTKENVILVVEDNPMNQDMIRVLFQQLGLEIHQALNGKEGVKKAFELKPHLILMDLHMPEVDGLTATRQIRSNIEFAKIPIVALSADAFAEQKRRAFDAGISDYLTKPIEFQTLFPVLIKYLHQDQPVKTKETPSLPLLPDNVKKQILDEFKALSKIPVFDVGSVCDQIEKMMSLVENFDSPFPNILVQIEKMSTENDEDSFNKLIAQAIRSFT